MKLKKKKLSFNKNKGGLPTPDLELAPQPCFCNNLFVCDDRVMYQLVSMLELESD